MDTRLVAFWMRDRIIRRFGSVGYPGPEGTSCMALTTASGRPGCGAGVPTGAASLSTCDTETGPPACGRMPSRSSTSPDSKYQSISKTASASTTMSPVTSTLRSAQVRPARILERSR